MTDPENTRTETPEEAWLRWTENGRSAGCVRDLVHEMRAESVAEHRISSIIEMLIVYTDVL